MPRLSTAEYRALIDALAAHVASHPFNLTEITRSVRDRLRAEGRGVPRQAIAFVVRGALYGGRPLNSTPPPGASEIAAAFFRSIVQSATSAQLVLSEDERRRLYAWLGGPGDLPAE
jgi:hypothetical protein